MQFIHEKNLRIRFSYIFFTKTIQNNQKLTQFFLMLPKEKISL